MNDSHEMSEKELLMLNREIMKELEKREVTRTMNNPISDYCEWLVGKTMNWKLKNSSNGGFDAVDLEGLRVQIKCRIVENGLGTRQLGVMRNLRDNPFDYLVAIVFNERFEVLHAYKISKGLIGRYSRFSSHQNGNILTLRGAILLDKDLIDMTALFN